MKEILITSSVMIAALLVLRLVFAKKVSRRLIYGAWVLVALRLLIPVQIGQLDFSVLNAAKDVTQTIEQVSTQPIAGPSQQEVYKDIVLDYLEKDRTAFAPQVQEQIREETAQGTVTKEEIADKIQQNYPQQEIFTPQVQQQVQQQVAETVTASTLGQIATAVWLVGIAVMAVWFAMVNLRHGRSLRRGAQKMDCHSPVPVFLTEHAASPCLVGLLRPAVYLTPASAANEESRRHVLIHELTHYRHGDHIWSLMRCLCLCVYWFNPLVWAAAWVSRRDCELACDEGALKRLGEEERIAYGKTLLEVVSHAATPANLLQTATAMAETKKQLKERVNFIVKKPKISLIAVICMVLICAIVAGCVAAGPADDQEAEFETVPTQTYISVQSVDNKLAIVYDDALYLMEYRYHKTIPLTMSLDGKSAVCGVDRAVLYIHDGTVEKITDYAYSYSFSVSGNTIAFWVDESNTDKAGLSSGLYLYRKESGQIEQVVTAADGEVRDYTLSPDGQTLAYVLVTQGKSQLMLHQNGSSTLRLTFKNNNGYKLISIDNSTDIIYLRTQNGALSCVNKAGQQTSIGRVDRYLSEYDDTKGYLYLNADHTQLLYDSSSVGRYLSERGQEGVWVSTWALIPMEPALSAFHHGKNAVTCNVDDMKNQVMQANAIMGIQFLRYDESGQYVTVAECDARKENCWLDPTQRYVYYTDADKKLYVLDLESGGESVLLAENVDHFTVSYDSSTLYYANRYLYEYEDGLQKYGGNLFKCDPKNGSVLEKIETDVILDLFFSENNQMFFLTTDNIRHTLHTVNKKGEVKTVLENVVQFTRDDCGLLFVETDAGYYIIRGGQLIQLQTKSLA